MLRMFKNCGIDIRTEPILVYPTLHYQNGGIDIDVSGGSVQVENLFAAGEVVGGIHGRNRLMGNSLLDIIVFGRTAGKAAAERSEVSPSSGDLSLGHVREFEELRRSCGLCGKEVSPVLLPDYTRKVLQSDGYPD